MLLAYLPLTERTVFINDEILKLWFNHNRTEAEEAKFGSLIDEASQDTIIELRHKWNIMARDKATYRDEFKRVTGEEYETAVKPRNTSQSSIEVVDINDEAQKMGMIKKVRPDGFVYYELPPYMPDELEVALQGVLPSMRLGRTVGGAATSATAKLQKLLSLVKDVAAKNEEGTLMDRVRPGIVHAYIPVREIVIRFGKGTIRYALHLKISLDTEKTFTAKAYLWRCVYNSADNAANAYESERDIAMAWEKDWFGTFYRDIGTTKEDLKTMPTEDAIRIASVAIGDFEGILDELFAKISPH